MTKRGGKGQNSALLYYINHNKQTSRTAMDKKSEEKNVLHEVTLLREAILLRN